MDDDGMDSTAAAPPTFLPQIPQQLRVPDHFGDAGEVSLHMAHELAHRW
jgi:hypothetical protein